LLFFYELPHPKPFWNWHLSDGLILSEMNSWCC
jgi:hypothetical protein